MRPRNNPLSRVDWVWAKTERVEARAPESSPRSNAVEWLGEYPRRYDPDVNVISIVLHASRHRRNTGRARRVSGDDAPTIVERPEHRKVLAASYMELVRKGRFKRLMCRSRLRGGREIGKG
jgi:hypothetical protein